MSGEGGERPTTVLCRRWRRWVAVAGAAAGTACLAVPVVTRWQQPWQRRRRPVSEKGCDRPTTVLSSAVATVGCATAVAGTACLTVPSAKR